MPQVRRATIAAEVHQKISAWLDKAGPYISPDSWEFKSWFNLAEKLSNADPYASTSARAMLMHMAGDIREAARWISNLQKYSGFRVQNLEFEIIILSNLGYFSVAAEKLVAARRFDDGVISPSLDLVCCNLTSLIAVADGMKVALSEEWQSAVDIARRCSMTLERLQVSERQVQAILDVAGEVLRQHKMFFADERPIVHSIDEGVLYELQVRADAKTTRLMTNEVIGQMVARDLDVPGVSFSFVPA